MNFLQTQLVMNDGRTLREQATDKMPADCPYAKSLERQLAPRNVSIEEFEEGNQDVRQSE